MAQNDLLAPLHEDAMIPDFCRNGHEGPADRPRNTTGRAPDAALVGHGRLYSVMMWLGPQNNVTC